MKSHQGDKPSTMGKYGIWLSLRKKESWWLLMSIAETRGRLEPCDRSRTVEGASSWRNHIHRSRRLSHRIQTGKPVPRPHAMIRGRAKTSTMTAPWIGVFERKIKNPILPMSHIGRIWRKTGEFSRNERPAVKAGCQEMSGNVRRFKNSPGWNRKKDPAGQSAGPLISGDGASSEGVVPPVRCADLRQRLAGYRPEDPTRVTQGHAVDHLSGVWNAEQLVDPLFHHRVQGGNGAADAEGPRRQ